MSTTTTNYGLIKPDTTDPILIGQLNDNADIIDNALKENADALGGKVDKETGKGLSTNDFTTAEKTKLDDLAEIKSIGTGLDLDSNGELTATGGGSGGTTNYNDLSNKPQINGNTLSGNKTSAQLGLASTSDIPTVPITAIQKNGTGITPVSGTVNITVPTQASDINAATATQGDKADTAIQGIKVNNSTVNPDSNKVVSVTVPTTAADVSALPDTTKYAAALSLTINSSTYVVTGQLKDQNGDNLGTAQTIDLPLESVVVGGSYNSQTKKVVLTLQNGNTIEFSVADLVSGLQTELSASNKLNPAYINYDSAHRAVSDTEKSTWNGKQDALTTAQLAAVNSGIDSAKVEQIETNKTNIELLQALFSMCFTVAPPCHVTNGSVHGVRVSYEFKANMNPITMLNIDFTVSEYGLIYSRDGTVSDFKKLTLDNVDGTHIIKVAANGQNIVDNGYGVLCVGYVVITLSNGTTFTVYTNEDIGGKALELPTTVSSQALSVPQLTSIVEKNTSDIAANGLTVVLSQNANVSTTYTYSLDFDDFPVCYLISIITSSSYSLYSIAFSGNSVVYSFTKIKIAGNDANISVANGIISVTSSGKVTIMKMR